MDGLVHLRCGSDILGKLAAAGLPGARLDYSDPICHGPPPAALDGRAFRAVRAGFLAAAFGAADAAERLAAQDAALGRAAATPGEFVLWFEADLYDRAILVRVLDRLAAGPARLTLVCIAEHPTVARFVGLGQLAPDDLARLFAGRAPVTPAQIALARRAWAAFRAPEPSALAALVEDGAPELPYLAAAL